MLSKRFYDWATGIFVIIIIAGLIIFPLIMKSSMPAPGENPFSGTKSMFLKISYLNAVWNIAGFVYYVFVLVLAIQLVSIKKISVLETICVAIFIPFAFIFYLVSLRKYVD